MTYGIPIHVGNTKRTNLVTFGDTCPVCKQNSRMLLTKQELFDILIVIPLWKKEYLATCDKCLAEMVMDKKLGMQFEQSVKTNDKLGLIKLVTTKNKYVEVKNRYVNL
jgi:hypothetical protein